MPSRRIFISITIGIFVVIAALTTVRFVFPEYGDAVDYVWAILNIGTGGLCGYAILRSRSTQRYLEERFLKSPYVEIDMVEARKFLKRSHLLLYIAGSWNIVWGVLNAFHFFR